MDSFFKAIIACIFSVLVFSAGIFVDSSLHECPICPDIVIPDPVIVYVNDSVSINVSENITHLYVSVLFCGKFYKSNESNLVIHCDDIVIAPEYYNNTVICYDIEVAGTWNFQFNGTGVVL